MPGQQLRTPGAPLDLGRALVMGIVNATPDSFSDVGLGQATDDRVERALAALDSGADLIDIGGQSGITGVPEISEQEEIDRVLPVVEGVLARRPEAVVSVDTYRPSVAEAVLGAGASIVNDVSCLLHDGVAEACAHHGAALVVMHTTARPKVRRQDPDAHGPDVAGEVAALLTERIERARRLGVADDAVIVDPGVDYAKTPHQTITMLRDPGAIRALGHPVLWALSRKDFVGAVTGRAPQERDAGTLAAIAHVDPQAGDIFRVHDVAATVDLLAVHAALSGRTATTTDLRLDDTLRWADGRAGRFTAPAAAAP